MPRRKKVLADQKEKPAFIEHPTPRQGITSYAKSSYKWAESYTSLLMGVVVVIVAVLFVISLVRATHHVQDTSSTSTGPTSTTTTVTQLQPKTYTVQPGDDLWHIAEKVYNDGYKWTDIADANHLENPGTIFAGDKLILPDIRPSEITKTPETQATTPTNNKISIKGDTYTVVTGDTLWDIAVRAYADGYRWVDIVKANNLQNPNLIFSGNVLKIPR